MEKGEDTLSFVLLLEQYKVLLRNAQNPVIKKQKEIAVNAVIVEWLAISKKKLEPESLLKKISNLKQKVKAVSKKGLEMTEWQTKLQELTKSTDVVDPILIQVPFCGDEREKTFHMMDEAPAQVKAGDIVNYDTRQINGDGGESAQVIEEPQALVNADDIVNLYETPQTKLLTNQQLQRIVFLKQLTVLELQQKKLQCNTCNACNSCNMNAVTIADNIDINFEYIGFNRCEGEDLIQQ